MDLSWKLLRKKKLKGTRTFACPFENFKERKHNLLGNLKGIDVDDFRRHGDFGYFYFDLILAGSLKDKREGEMKGDIYLLRCIPESQEYLKDKNFCYGFFVGEEDNIMFSEENGFTLINDQRYPVLLEAKIYVYHQNNLTGFLQFQRIGSSNFNMANFRPFSLRFSGESEQRQEYKTNIILLDK